MKNNRCLIFGGGGFIGSHLTEALLEKKYSVSVFSRKSDKVLTNLFRVLKNITFIEGDFNNISHVKKVINPDDIVFDLIASSVPYSSSLSPIEEIKYHIFSHVQLIKAACEKKVKKIIITSSGGAIYGEVRKLHISEKTLPQPSSPHAIGKITIEYYLSYFGKRYKIPNLVYRISNPFGPRQLPEQGFAVIPTLFSHILKRTKPVLFDHGNLIRDYIYIDDLIQAIISSFNKINKYSIYNLGSGKGTNLLTLWSKIQKITNSKINPIYKPKRDFDVEKNVLDITRFSSEYQWLPKISLHSGLIKTWKWLNPSV